MLQQPREDLGTAGSQNRQPHPSQKRFVGPTCDTHPNRCPRSLRDRPSRVVRKLGSDILAGQENGLEGGPLPLHAQHKLQKCFHLSQSGLPIRDLPTKPASRAVYIRL